MKKLTRFILASYFRPFIRSLIVSLFLLVLQFLSRYKDDLFGKGLDADVILKIFGYASVSLIVLALPVSVLLASLFTMGTFGEQYELAAMRSSGLSIRRIITPMVTLTLIVAFISFGLSSYVIPLTNLKLYSLLYDVKQLKPSFSLEPGHFNSDIDNYVIRIEDKDVSKEMLYNVMIYDHTEGRGNDRLVMADSAIMKVDPYGAYMNMWLFDGASFENNYTDKGRITEKESFVRTHYKALYYNFDLAGFSLERTAEEDFASHHYMLNLDDLDFSMDTVLAKKDTVVQEYRSYIEETARIDSSFLDIPDSTLSIPPDNIILTFPKYKRREVMRRALSSATGLQKAASVTANRYEDKELRYRNYLIEYHAKFSLPVACIIFLFIGAPLGAVVRKGGVGVPILVSVTFYLSFYVIMIQGKKMATEAVVPVWLGVWLPILVLFPLAVLFTYQAASMRDIKFGLIFYAVRTRFQDFLVFILRPIFRLFRGQQVAPETPEQRTTILPDDLTLPDQTVGAESELARWEQELGISVEGTGVPESKERELELPDQRGDEDELARMERELGISLRDEPVEETKERDAVEAEVPVGEMELPDQRGDEDELARMERELGISLRDEPVEETKERDAVEAEVPVGEMELPDMRGDEDELARMERELGISLRDAPVEETEERDAVEAEVPVGEMELPDMRGDEDELARMERELGISLRDEPVEETKDEEPVQVENEVGIEPSTLPDLPQMDTSEPEADSQPTPEPEVQPILRESSYQLGILDFLSPGPSEEAEATSETPASKTEEQLELERWEKELGISFSAQANENSLFDLNQHIPIGQGEDGENQAPTNPELEKFENDLDFTIDLDLMDDTDLD